jgi:hypothetical protein
MLVKGNTCDFPVYRPWFRRFIDWLLRRKPTVLVVTAIDHEKGIVTFDSVPNDLTPDRVGVKVKPAGVKK